MSPLYKRLGRLFERYNQLYWHEKLPDCRVNAAALPYYQRAIELDPNFAMGYAALGTDYRNLSQTERASEYYTKAFQLRDHASDWEG